MSTLSSSSHSISRVKITGHAIMGIGPFQKAFYRMEIELRPNRQASGTIENYALYRRFSDFLIFYNTLLQNFGTEKVKVTYGIQFPEKENTGTFGSTFNSIIQHRIPLLQAFINKALQIEDIHSLSPTSLFFDLKNKGTSGARRQLGDKRVLKEVIAKTKPGKYGVLEFWESSFVVLTQQGRLFILKNLYDDLSSSTLSLSLANGAVHLSAKADCVAELFVRDTATTVQIRFSSAEEHTSWLRTLADATTMRVTEAEEQLPPALSVLIGSSASSSSSSSSGKDWGILRTIRKMAGGDEGGEGLEEDIGPQSQGHENDHLNSYGL